MSIVKYIRKGCTRIRIKRGHLKLFDAKFFFGIAGHGKSEVDHVGGLAKVAIQRETAAEKTFSNSFDMIECLREFTEKLNSSTISKDIKPPDLSLFSGLLIPYTLSYLNQ